MDTSDSPVLSHQLTLFFNSESELAVGSFIADLRVEYDPTEADAIPLGYRRKSPSLHSGDWRVRGAGLSEKLEEWERDIPKGRRRSVYRSLHHQYSG
jgi:hypothetical protein